LTVEDRLTVAVSAAKKDRPTCRTVESDAEVVIIAVKIPPTDCSNADIRDSAAESVIEPSA